MAKKRKKDQPRVVPYTVTNEDVTTIVAARACKFGGVEYQPGDPFPKPGTMVVTRSRVQQLYDRGFVTTPALLKAEQQVEGALRESGPVTATKPSTVKRDPIGKKDDDAKKA